MVQTESDSDLDRGDEAPGFELPGDVPDRPSRGCSIKWPDA